MIVEDKTIKWLIRGLIKKINENYNIIEKDENIDYVENDKKDICCGIYTLRYGKGQIRRIPGPKTSGFDKLKSILLIADNDAKKEIKYFYKKLKEMKKNGEEIELYYYHHCLIPSKSKDGNEIEDYIYNRSDNSNRVKFDEINNFIDFFIKNFSLNIPCPPNRLNKRILNILIYIESGNLDNLEENKCKYVENIINNIGEKERIFVELKKFLDNTK